MNALAQLGIDTTSLVLYTVNFGIIVFFVGKYLTGPLIEMMEKRRSVIKDNLSEAESLRLEMSKQKDQIESEKELMQKKFQEQEANLNSESDKKTSQLIKEAEIKSAQILDQANKFAEKKKTEIVSEAEKEIKHTVKNMVTYIVSNKIPQNVIVESVNEAWEKSAKKQ